MRVSDVSLIPKGDPDRIGLSYASDKGYMASIIPIGTLAEKRPTYTTGGGHLLSGLC
jgi:hypothetical protein